MKGKEFEFIRTLVYEHSRINLGPDKHALVNARLGKRLRAVKLPTIDSYCKLLQSPEGKDELSHLIDAISTNHTFFFRENAHFELLQNVIVPAMLERRVSERWSRFDVWSAASSSGEEPYSIAITLAECLEGTHWPWHIEATDISHRILAKAVAGIYRDDVVEKLPKPLIKKYFQQGFGPQEGNYRVSTELRKAVAYRQLNLLNGEPPFSHPFHVIFCRNVMIYFDRPTQEELVNKLTRWLVPGGYLCVGHSESLTGIKHQLQPIKPAVYRRPLSSRS